MLLMRLGHFIAKMIHYFNVILQGSEKGLFPQKTKEEQKKRRKTQKYTDQMQSNPNKIKLINLTVIYTSESNKRQYGKGVAVYDEAVCVVVFFFQQIPVSVLSPL